MSDAHQAVERLQTNFSQAIMEIGSVHGIPMLRLKKQDVPAVTHFLHTNPGLQGSLSLLGRSTIALARHAQKSVTSSHWQTAKTGCC